MDTVAFLLTMLFFPVIYWIKGYKTVSVIALAVFILNSVSLYTLGYAPLESAGLYFFIGLFFIAKPDSIWFNKFYNENKKTKSIAKHSKKSTIAKKEPNKVVESFIASGNIKKRTNPVDNFLKKDEKEKLV